MSNPNIHEIESVDQITEARLWKALDGISSRLSNIEDKLSNVIRLEEKVNNHDDTLARFGNRLDIHEKKIHSSELWQANRNDLYRIETIERTIKEVSDKVDVVKQEQDAIKESSNVDKGQKDIWKEILKWISTIFGGIIIFMMTNGDK